MKLKFLSGSWLKLIAVLSMLIDHLACFVWVKDPAFMQVLFSVGSRAITPYVICRMAGRLAFPIFAFLIVEGFIHTKDRKKYGLNLFIFALISEIPWNLAHCGGILYPKQNVMFTLFLGYIALCALERFSDGGKTTGFNASAAWQEKNLWLSIGAIFVTAFFLRADYGYTGVAFILMLYLLRDWKPVQALVGCCMLPMRWVAGLAFIPINLYSGKRGFIHGPIWKYAFYAFYPVHLFLIWLIPLVF